MYGLTIGKKIIAKPPTMNKMQVVANLPQRSKRNPPTNRNGIEEIDPIMVANEFTAFASFVVLW
jgi:hypothetical protein